MTHNVASLIVICFDENNANLIVLTSSTIYAFILLREERHVMSVGQNF